MVLPDPQLRMAMRFDSSFRFVDDELNNRLLRLVEKADVVHRVDRNGVIHYRAQDAEVMENDLICAVREQACRSWQVLSCPSEWTARYKLYMSVHGISYHEELIDDQISFLLPRKYRPNTWKLDERKTRQKARLAH